MKALVYHGPRLRSWDTVNDPAIIDPSDVVVRIDTSTICGSDLHIVRGDVPEMTPGTVLGHEAVGTVQEIGANVSTVALGAWYDNEWRYSSRLVDLAQRVLVPVAQGV